MGIGKSALVLGSLQQLKRLEVVANNVANAGTAGYKRDDALFSHFVYQATYTDFGPGSVRATENPLDVALLGDGYLRVQSDEGVVYTRAGNLTLNQDNVLVTQEGWPVLGKSGPIQVQDARIRIDPSGQVFDYSDGAENLVDTLDMVKFAEDTPLRKVKNGYIKPVQEAMEPTEAEDCRVQQGALEGANFNVVEEMTRLVETMRAFEAYQKASQTQGELDSQLITKLGNA
ncbi:MAG: flagellar hook basal-body protein [Deltaproteobacteria bacterium]|nr:flagellar hook basal-body protein [Deltaproteobacteria bacterium]